MTFANDSLYKGYLRRNLPTIVTTVKPREIMIHLPCLTDHDRETIDAKTGNSGNFEGMVLLLDCLKRRENWPEQFINALKVCEHHTIADKIRAEYDALRGINNSSPSSPPTTVIRAHIHPAPSASHLSVPESGANSQAAVSLPAEASAPPEPAAQPSPPLEVPVQPQAPQSAAAQVPEAVSTPEPVAQIEVAAPPSTPPPSPETPHTQASTTPLPQREVNSHQEPVENSESDIQDISRDNGVIPDQEGAGNGEVSISAVETDTPSRPDPLQTAATTTEVRPAQSPSPAQINSDVTDGSSFHIMTPEKHPVQDTTPPVDPKPAAVLLPEEMSEPPATQVVESSPQTETAATNSPLPGAAAASLSDDDDPCLSKPGQLISIHPQSHESPTLPAPSPPVEPYSGDTARLEMSEATVTSARVPACSVASSTTVNTNFELPCQENGIALSHNQPEENHYESPNQSLDMGEVRENVVHISEEPSILDQDGQTSTPQAQIFNGEAAKEITAPPPLSTNTADTHTPSSENFHPSEPAPADISPERETALPANIKYFLTAAGVGACALLMAWKLKN